MRFCGETPIRSLPGENIARGDRPHFRGKRSGILGKQRLARAH